MGEASGGGPIQWIVKAGGRLCSFLVPPPTPAAVQTTAHPAVLQRTASSLLAEIAHARFDGAGWGPLPDMVRNERAEVPRAVVALCQYLSQPSVVKQEGLFRISGDANSVREIIVNLRQLGMTHVDDEDWVPRPRHHTYAAVLKHLLRDDTPALKEFLADKVSLRIVVDAQVADGERFEALVSVICELPPELAQLIMYLFVFLSRITAESKTNRMDPNALGLVFLPNVFHPAMLEFILPRVQQIVVEVCCRRAAVHDITGISEENNTRDWV
mmetsp:Transcript_30463/g.69309  ORF Transcript_30463/g.69309 Transcript_30463/m.69309 type:complete len:271 (+) Transcript_30463:9-821(+)